MARPFDGARDTTLRRRLARTLPTLTAALAALTLCATAAATGATGSAGATGASGATDATSGTGSTGATGATGGKTAGATGVSPDILVPLGRRVFTGVSGVDANSFARETGMHPAVYGVFVTWGDNFKWAFHDANAEHSRLMLHISTSEGYGAKQTITPESIAEGHGDGYLLKLSAAIAAHGAPVYIRLFAEMNNANNAYSADNLDGSPRGPAYSHTMFKQAWRRIVTILRGGPVSTIDAKLAALHLPPVQGEPTTDTIAVSPIDFMWVPETAGTPNVPSESAASYWPGSAYVDWVGTDFYSKFPNFPGLVSFYNEFRGKPFVFGEWAMWDTNSAAFVKEFFSFIATHRRVKMILYNEGFGSSSPLLLAKYPAAAAEIRKVETPSRFVSYTPEWAASAPAAVTASHRSRRHAAA